MKRIFSNLLLIGLLILPSCVNDLKQEIDIQDGALPVRIGGEIDQEYATRAIDSGFCDGDAVGIFAVNRFNGQPGILSNSGNQADNVRYVFNEPQNNWVADKDVYYYDKNTNADLYGYYPYANTISDVNSYSFEVRSDQSTVAQNGQLSGYEASDFLWGCTSDVIPTDNVVNISFKHRMASLSVTLTKGDGWDSDDEWHAASKAVLVTNTIRTARIDLSTGTASTIGDAPSTGIVPQAGGNDSWRAVIVPQEITAGKSIISVTIDGRSRELVRTDTYTYYQGKMNTIALAVNKQTDTEGIELKVISESITAWENDPDSHDATGREYVIVNCPEGGKLEETILAEGYDLNRIKNLKVNGIIDERDFYAIRDNMPSIQAINMRDVRIVSIPGRKGKDDIIPYGAFQLKRSLVKFVFPKNVREIGGYAFSNTSLSGSLILPDGLEVIESGAFSSISLNGTLEIPASVTKIGSSAFADSHIYGNLILPDGIETIEGYSFHNNYFSGQLILPESLKTIDYCAFYNSGSFTGGLVIPQNVEKIEFQAFFGTRIAGRLVLNENLISIGSDAFNGSGFGGGLKIPDSVITIGDAAFAGNSFTSLSLPSGLQSLGIACFSWSPFSGEIVIPQDITTIPDYCFQGCSSIESVVFPKGLERIGDGAFDGCFGITSIICNAATPPTITSSSFNGVAKDNFTVEVPEASVARYSNEVGWNEFKRFAAHREFSVSRNKVRALNASLDKDLIIRAPSGASWSVESAPDWVSINPDSGTGNTAISIHIDKLADGNPNRSDEITFLLDSKDYRVKTSIEQFNCNYGDGDVITNYTHTQGTGVNLVFMGDCFDAKDISEGKYLDGINEAIGYFFDIEPYKSYKEYFNVYTIVGMSADSGMGTVNTIRESRFGTQYTLNAGLSPDSELCFSAACLAPINNDVSRTLIVMVENSSEYSGITYMWGDGSAIALCPMSRDEYPYDFRGLVQHEAGGHGFGKLADEYIYYNSYLQTCIKDCNLENFLAGKSHGWYENLSLEGSWNRVPWSHLIFDEKYSNIVDVYEGGYKHSRGVFRSEPTSCMNNNIPYFSTISRESIVKRIMNYSGQEYSFEDFKAKDVIIQTKATVSTPDHSVSYPSNGGHRDPVFMGEKPSFKPSK